MILAVVKGSCVVLTLLSASAGSLLPMYFGKSFRAKDWLIQLSQGFSGGVIIGAGLLHMLPDANTALSSFQFGGVNFPIAHFLFGVGFMVVFLLEVVFFTGLVEEDHMIMVGSVKAKDGQQGISLCSVKVSSVLSSPPLHSSVVGPQDGERIPLLFDRKDAFDCKHCDDHTDQRLHHEIMEHYSDITESKQSDSMRHKHNVHHQHMEFNAGKGFLSYVLAMALSFHSILAGLALGAACDMHTSLSIAIAILSHKWAESFALGVQVLKESITVQQVLAIGLFYSSMTPIGIIIGWLLVNSFTTATATALSAALGSTASGAFLYVGVLSITEETASLKFSLRVLKILFVFSGFFFMAAICFVGE